MNTLIVGISSMKLDYQARISSIVIYICLELVMSNMNTLVTFEESLRLEIWVNTMTYI